MSSTEHVLWECPAVHRNYDPRRFALVGKRESGEITTSLALTGVVQADYCTLEPTEAMRRVESVGDIVGKVKTVYIDGSAYSAGGTKFAGWGMWSADNADFCIGRPLVGRRQSSDRAEVRALVAAVESAEDTVDVVTDNMYVKDTAEIIKMGGNAGGAHRDLWARFSVRSQIWAGLGG